MPWTSGSALRASIVARSFDSWHVVRQAEQRPAHPGGLAGVLLVPDVNLAGGIVADEDDRQARDPARSGPGGSATSSATWFRMVWARALPSRMRAANGQFLPKTSRTSRGRPAWGRELL